jgi:hypothetical protein
LFGSTPLSMTTPFTVLTLTLKPLLTLSAMISDFTLVVIQLSEPTRSVWATALCIEPLLEPPVNSSSTLLTPSTFFATSSAAALESEPVADPVSVTTPLVVVTLMCDPLRRSSPRKFAFTLVVIALSLIAAPTLSLCAVGAVSLLAAFASRQRPKPAAAPIVVSARRT